MEKDTPAAGGGILRLIGPGLVTGASDDDPSGIATYSQVGAQFGYGMLWTMLFSYPLMTSIQEVCGQIGRVTGRGIASNMNRNYPRWVVLPVVAAMVVANLINLAADIAAMGEAARLIVGGPAVAYAVMFAAGSLVLQVLLPYNRYASLLKWLTLVLLAYVATVFVIHVPWGTALRRTVMPGVKVTPAYLTALIAVLGTTISPYLFFWQASQEKEEVRNRTSREPLVMAPEQAPRALRRIRIDTLTGMAVSNLVAFFIILTCTVTLHDHGTTNIQTAAQAAEALRPVAGRFAFALFALGIIGTGLLAVPVLVGSAAYAVSELLGWRGSLDDSLREGKGFYGIIALGTLIAAAMNFTPINPVKALFWSAVINGVVSVPVMVITLLMARNRKVMGDFTITGRLLWGGWAATAVMFAAAVGMFATWGR